MTASPTPDPTPSENPSSTAAMSPTRRLLLGSIPALIIGILSAVGLALLTWVSESLEHLVWTALPESFGLSGDIPWWTIGVLTLAGLLTGLLVRFAPGHAGPDPAKESFFPPALPMSALPALALAAIITLAGGVSLGPEAPTIAINVALSVALCRVAFPAVPAQGAMIMAVTGTFGALFGSPIGAALLVTTIATVVHSSEPLWDRLFLPLVSASAGTLVIKFVGGHDLTMGAPAYEANIPVDLAVAVAVMLVGIVAGLALLLAFPHVHRAFHRWNMPVLTLTLAGLLLGVLGAIGGPITLFKGLEQAGELVETVDDYTPWALVLIIVVKIVALLIAGASGFRGGRIFPAVFIGVAIGLLAYTLFPGIPMALALSAGVLGICLVVVRDGWLSLFIAAVVAGDMTVLPVLTMVVLPGWLLVARLPQMRLGEDGRPATGMM